MESLKQTFGDILRGIDCFSFPVHLRYNQLPKYSTRTGGIISLGLLIALISVFYTSWYNVLNKKIATSTMSKIKSANPQRLTVTTKDYLFALGVIGIDLNSNQEQYFNIVAQAIYKDNQNSQMKIQVIPLSKCQKSSWAIFGEDFEQSYSRLQLNKFWCPPDNFTINLQGKYASSNFSYIKITFKKCTGLNCKSQKQFNDYISKKKAFYWNFFYANTLLNPEKQIPITKALEDKDYLLVSDKLGIDMNVYLSQYTVKTDQSVLPLKKDSIIKGVLIDKAEHQKWNYIPNNQVLSKIYLRKSDYQIRIQRTFTKVDDVLSYIGGLFGTIIAILGFILRFYSQCSLQLKIAHNIFMSSEQESTLQKSYSDYSRNGQTCSIGENSESSMKKSIPQEYYKQDQNKNKVMVNQSNNESQVEYNFQQHQLSFNLLSYFKYLIYLGLSFFGLRPKWKITAIYEETLTQTRKQIDINTLLQKIVFYDKAIHTLFNEDQLKLLYLQQKFKIKEIKKEREMLGLGNNMKKGILAEFSNLISNAFWKNNRVRAQNVRQNKQIQNKKYQNKKLTLKPIKFLSERRSVLEITHTKNHQLPLDIERAIKNLSVKIKDGDLISKRIYEGLQPQLITMYKQNQKNFQKVTIQENKHLEYSEIDQKSE